ncbi:MAG TPA: hypothetical protein PK331_14760 [Gordonia sp. (in: high G+C Gram-positive bacteria)]|uniref:hypothetical protein n=1 Tax=unclassified Gordonia (in: high G+C Gram-positive bacteria) TaxID=2657482 RepID=UPI000F904E81|nr:MULTISPECIES: hypothetical protein [unclassified Gordonia (in: high G+C Gram-positive bacteria)]RUP39667.1 MAG: hypothetical protein EKK60_06525 [Gordonia sp. (in: high G+C Gram-positive bacteria)]HNP58869.1 hypothetical protein [Gordonia sp. (in: high G+C Gram-positive bacteria)]HRC52169.1 hypothetical protein [Gordonia sp. (in: high G+C Gram-positive bacteria)]
MGYSAELERLVTLSRHQIKTVCADESQIPGFIELCREKFDEHLAEYDDWLDDDENQAHLHWQEAVAWRETAALLTTMTQGPDTRRRSA